MRGSIQRSLLPRRRLSNHYEYVGSWLNPIENAIRLLETVHTSTGWTWPVSLALFTVGMRSLLMPFAVRQARATAVTILNRPQIEANRARIESFRTQGLHAESWQAMAEATRFLKSKGASPWKIVAYSLMPLPFYMSTFLAVQRMARQPIESLMTEGCGWFVDLSVPDPYMVLPVVSGSLILVAMELGKRFASTPVSSTVSMIMRVGVIASVAAMSYFPSAMLVYFVSANLFTIFQVLLINLPAFKRLAKIPVLPTTSMVERRKAGPSAFQDLYRERSLAAATGLAADEPKTNVAAGRYVFKTEKGQSQVFYRTRPGLLARQQKKAIE